MSRKPSPSLVVSIIALVFAVAGTSIAAVNFAKNAGAVDGKSAVGAASSSKRAAGKLVATASSGPLKGKIPSRFLEIPGVTGFITGSKQTFGQGMSVTDNAANTAVSIGGTSSLGLLTATCSDQNTNAGKEDPRVSINFATSAGTIVNFSRSVGGADPTVTTIAAGAQASFMINNSNSFHVYAQLGSANYVFDGIFRVAFDAAGVKTVTRYQGSERNLCEELGESEDIR